MTPSSPPTAVVVNDDPTQLNFLAGLLRKASLTPQAFSDAEAALHFMLETAPPALIVTDLYMPNLDGWRFCRLLRSVEYAALNAVPIMVVSATFTGEESYRIAKNLGANLFMPAPVDGPFFISQARMLAAGEVSQVRPRALILEDSPTLTGLLRKTLAGQGYQPDTAASLVSGLQMVDQTAYDLALLDYHLPDGQGDQVLDWLHSHQPDCVCIMMTSDPHPHLALDWMKRGAAAYLRKPFAMDYLLEVVERTRRERALLRVEDLLEARTRELRESEDRYKSIVEKSFAGVYVVQNGHFVFINHNAASFAGCRPEELIGKRSNSVVHPEDRSETRKKAQRRLDAESSLPYEFRILTKSGQVRWIMETVSTIQYDGNPAVLGNSMDITDRKQAEMALQESSRRYRELFENSRDGFVVVNIEGRFLDANEAYCEMLGYSLDDLKAKEDFYAVTPERWREWEHNEIWHNRLLKTGASGVYEKEYIRKNGTLFPAELQSFTVRDKQGNIQYLWGIARDITDRRQAETEQANLQAQLIQAQKMESIGALAGGVAHDFNNMLSVIMGHAELGMLETEPEAPLWRRLKQIMEVSRRSTDMVQKLMAFARKQIIDPRVLNLNYTMDEMLTMLRHLIGEHIHLIWRPCPEQWRVKLDPAQIDQILANLCVNARDAIADTGSITIETQAVSLDDVYCTRHLGCTPGDYVLLSITDTGSGISAESLPHIFDPFYTTKEVGRGTGLGLATVYGIVKQNQGYIMAYSEPQQGTCFKIYLPRHLEAAPEKMLRAASTPLSGGHETILLVEDNEALLEMGVMMLKTLGYQVLSAAAPQEALGLADTHCGEINLLITDVILPDINGRELASRLKTQFPHLRCLFMSGYTADIIADKGILNEGVQFIQKPFSLRQLAVKVREVVEGER